jgi:cell filamentation protein
MVSKYHLKSNSIYIKDTDIPYNKLGINNPEELHELEGELLEEAYQVFYQELDEQTLFNEEYFKSLHQRTFEGLYEWAGEYRQFNMSKGTSRFCQGAYIASSSAKIFNDLAKINYLKEIAEPKAEFSKQLAHFKCELIALHPFYELNGRITRLFFDMIAISNGYSYIDYSNISPETYINASIECVQFANSYAMEKIIANGLK